MPRKTPKPGEPHELADLSVQEIMSAFHVDEVTAREMQAIARGEMTSDEVLVDDQGKPVSGTPLPSS